MDEEGVQENLEPDTEEKDSSLQCITFSSAASWPNSITWSEDGRIAVLTDNCIYILSIAQSPRNRKQGATFGLQLDTNIIKNIDRVTYDVGISTQGFSDATNVSFMDRQKFLLDRTTVIREDFLTLVHSYCQAKWSPLGCTSDSSSLLATRCSNGNVYIQKSLKILGQWEVVLDVSKELHKCLEENDWFESNKVNAKTDSINNNDIDTTKKKKKYQNLRPGKKSKNNAVIPTLERNEEVNEYCRRKYLLFTEAISWCPITFKCLSCHYSNQNNMMDNPSYESYFNTYVFCNHKLTLFLTSSRAGQNFIWLLNFDIEDEIDHGISLLFTWYTDIKQPVSTAWYQTSTNEGFVAIGYSNGEIKVFHLFFEIQNGSYICECKHSLDVWKEADDINVSFLEWIFPKDCLLRLVAVKATEIIVFKMLRQSSNDDQLVCSACEIAPSCHATPITSLECIANKYVLTSSWSATQYFDIENESLPYCERNILRGFKCLGITGDPYLTMFARVSSPNRLLLLQPLYVKQMEISFLPFLSAEQIADRLINQSISLDISVREYFLLTSTENFLLPNILHEYCDEPLTYDDKSINDLRLYLCFNLLRYIQQVGLRAATTSSSADDTKKLPLSDVIVDPAIHKIERRIEYLYFQEILRKSLQLLQNNWFKQTTEGLLSLLLIADWLISHGDGMSHDLSMQCYQILQDESSEKKLNEFQDNLLENSNPLMTDITDNEINSGEIPKCSCKKEIKKVVTDDIDESTCKCTTSKDIEKQSKWSIEREICPYCNTGITISSSECRNGHYFTRCALTLRIFSSRNYRECSTCHRKARFKCYNETELTVDCVLVNIDLCPFCGGKFSSAVR